MTIRALIVVVIGSFFGFACGDPGEETNTNTSTPNVAPLFPANNEVGTWVEDASAVNPFTSEPNPAGVEICTTNDQAVAAVDGDAAPFHNHEFVAFGREWYMDGTATLELRVWQMEDATSASLLFTTLPVEDSRYNNTWTTVTFGDQARMVDTGVSFWYNVVQNAYFIEIQGLRPNTAPVKTSGEALLSAVVAKAP